MTKLFAKRALFTTDCPAEITINIYFILTLVVIYIYFCKANDIIK